MLAEIDFFDILQGQIAAFLLVLARTSGIFLMSPFFGSMNIPIHLRAATAIVITVLLFPVIVKDFVVDAPANVFMFAGTVAKELFVGWLIGFIAYVAFAAIQMAGKIMDMQIGFAVANVMDPTSGQQAPLTGSFMYNLSVIYFLVVNGHHMILTALADSFRALPFDAATWNPAMADFILDVTNGVLLVGMKIAMPVTFVILINNVGMGILARTMPQMNIFVVGIPLHLITGMFMLAMLMPFYVLFLDVMFNDMYANISKAIKLLVPG